MKQDSLPNKKKVNLGNDLLLELHYGYRQKAVLYRSEIHIKTVELTDKVAKKLLVVDLVELGAVKKQISDALKISRQSVYNYVDIKKHFGLEGLIHGYSLKDSKNRHKQRKIHEDKRPQGNKARQVEELRRAEKPENNAKCFIESSLISVNSQKNEKQTLPAKEQVFYEKHDWEASRYAGLFTYLIILISHWQWFSLIIKWFQADWRIFQVFLLMSGRNIRSIEQLKNIRSREAGIVIGLRKIPARLKIREWFYRAASNQHSLELLKDYFRTQIRTGLLSMRLWFTDGHLLPYTGKEQLHYAYNTQRRMPVMGQTNFVTCDITGRIVDFEIQEGKGNLRQRILDLPEIWSADLALTPIMVFDREAYDKKNFLKLTKQKIPFVCWDKHVNKTELDLIDEDKFTQSIKFNEKEYSIFEGEKSFTIAPEKKEGEENQKSETITLRHIYIWNHKSNRRTCGLAWNADQELSLKECTEAILSRWGASENTFKHIQVRHPFHYRPGFKFTKSMRQEIKNPKVKEQEGFISIARTKLNRLLKKLRKSEKNIKNAPKKNNVHKKIEETVIAQEEELEKLEIEMKKLPKIVNTSSMENYDSYNVLDNEGKNLFDFVTSSVWNARKELVDHLSRFCSEKSNEVIDLFYAITDCQGWVKNTEREVRVRLEPLQQPTRRAAQEQLCRWLTALAAKTPSGKVLIIDVGNSPLSG